MTTLETLIAARELLSDPARWTKGTSARDANGKSPENIHDGVCFCFLGAVWRVTSIDRVFDVERVLAKVVNDTTPFTNAVSFNDDPATTHADVLRIYDLAIERARQS